MLSAAKKSKVPEGEVRDLVERIHSSLVSLTEELAKASTASARKASEAPEVSETKSAESASADRPPDGAPEQTAQAGANGQAGLFDGTVELALPPPIGLEPMLRIHKQLKETPHVEVLNLGGSVDKGITIRMVLDTPIPLLSVVQELPGVHQVSEELPGSESAVPGRRGGEEPHLRRIVVTTRS